MADKVDIKGVFYKKNPKLARLIPGFIYKYLIKIIHEKDVNDFLARHGDKKGIEFVRAGIEDFNVHLTCEGEENIPKEGRFIFVSNHPLGGFDAFLIMNTVDKYFKNFRFLVNDILMNLKNLAVLFLPINKHGQQGIEAVKNINAAYESDMQILSFPAGLVSRKIKGEIVDLEWKKNFISKAIQSKRDVIPVHVSGRNSNFFYRLSNIRKFFGIKANIEMLYLVDETYRHQNEHITVKFGKPIPYTTFDKSKTHKQWAFYVKSKAYEMNNQQIKA
jgi:putative hemolysin